MVARIDLQDGRTIDIRPIGPDDRDALARGFQRLGPESRYRRFFGPVDHLSDKQLAYLTDVDHHTHEALVALDHDTREGVGVARFVQLASELAEPAIAVADDWQGRGVGSRLLDELCERAWQEGIRRFAAPVLVDNAVAINALSRLGPTRIVNHGREVEVLVELDGGRRPVATLHRLLRHAAEQSLSPRTLLWRQAVPYDADEG